MIGQGYHFIYYIFNAYSIRFFGNGYYAPVAMNILLTVLIAFLGSMVVERGFGFSNKDKKVFFALLLLHPDILAWSTIANLKDILVLLLHVLLFLSVIMLYKSRFFLSFAIAIPTTIILYFLRFYVPLLFAVAFFCSHFSIKKNHNRLFFLYGFIFLLVIIACNGINNLQSAFEKTKENWVNPLYGVIKFLFTPIPFHTDIAYSFLNFPALIHWILLPFAFLGFRKIWRIGTPFSRFFIFYCISFFCISSVYSEFQGPRHRVQLDFAFAVIQYIGLLIFLRKNIHNKKTDLEPQKSTEIEASM